MWRIYARFSNCIYVGIRCVIYDLFATNVKYLQLKPPHGPLDKAGAYGIQEKSIKNHFIEKIIGDESTVIGFPIISFKKVWLTLMNL